MELTMGNTVNLHPFNIKESTEFDYHMKQIFEQLIQSIVKDASNAANVVLSHSESYLTKTEHKALQDYHDLYFSKNKEVVKNKESANKQVDDIFDAAQEALSTGKDLDESAEQDKDIKDIRLKLSALNKKLEAIVQMDQGIKEKLVPVLSSMQFEDAINQRVTHIKDMWAKILDTSQIIDDTKIEAYKQSFKSLPTSVVETGQFYKSVLKEQPPETTEDEDQMFFF